MKTPTLEVRVHRKIEEALGICTFELVSADGSTLPAFSAGSHVDVELPGGLIRQYSLCNQAGETHRYVIGVLKEPNSRGGSRALHEEVMEGGSLFISSPRNHFALVHGARNSILFAGGIGITPILCMAERLAITGERFSLHYSTRSPERTAFVDRIQASAFSPQVQFHFDDGPDVQKLDMNAVLAAPSAGTHLYVCGPQGYMEAVLGAARALGWLEDQLHYEFFGAAPAKSDADASFQVKLASSGRVITIPSDKTVVQALDEAGMSIMTSCEQGVCGTCLTRVLEGEPDHRDIYLTPEEQARNDQFMPCCSRAKSSLLVLDL